MKKKITKKAYENMQDEHLAFIEANFGEDVKCNLGWVTDVDSMCTKIYSDPRQYVTTQINDDGSLTHTVESD